MGAVNEPNMTQGNCTHFHCSRGKKRARLYIVVYTRRPISVYTVLMSTVLSSQYYNYSLYTTCHIVIMSTTIIHPTPHVIMLMRDHDGRVVFAMYFF